MSEQVVKPNREPDHISKEGSYFWFTEMIWLCGYKSTWGEMVMKGSVVCVKDKKPCKSCDYCKVGDACASVRMRINIQQAYQHWAFGALEEAIFGKQDES